jgi:chemotaxis protein methyltransferase CheR
MINAEFFPFVIRLVEELCGVVLELDKEYLVAARLNPRLTEWGLKGLLDLKMALEREPRGVLAWKVVDALVPNETYFFRDPPFFQALEQEILPGLIARNAKKREISIWSAACSSGQEVYSLSLLLEDRFRLPSNWKVRVEATDISGAMVERARLGLYSLHEVNRGLPAHYLAKYFTRDSEGFRLSDPIRKMVSFQRLDLREPWPWAQPFDLILVRNVMIYFEKTVKQELLGRFQRLLAPGGHIFLGASETALFLNSGLKNATFGKVVGYQNPKEEKI